MAANPSIRTTPVPASRVSSGCVFGDSTPFPYPGNFIETIRHAVDCGVALLTAQHVIQRAMSRAADVDRARNVERARLEQMGGAVKRTVSTEMALNAERLLRAGARILDATRVAIDGEIQALETLAASELARTRRSLEEARGAARRAVETFLVLHEVPGTESSIRLAAAEDHYAAEAALVTPFGVEATFELLVPEAHEWGRPRRVGDLSPGTEVHVALESGLFFKKVAVQPVRLDRLFVSAARIAANGSSITLRKQPATGAGFRLDFEARGERMRVLLSRLGEDGAESPDPTIELTGEDAMHVLRLRQRVVDSTQDLAQRRTKMLRAAFDGRALLDLDEPRLVADRLVRCLAPTVREIARRSGAAGELVLRRHVQAGRRDEVYITTAELHEKVMTLPPLLRVTFDPLELDPHRSPRAPAPSVPAYVEVGDDEVQEISQVSVVAAIA